MKKLTTLFTTTMIALALMMAAPAAMAGKDKGVPADDQTAVQACVSFAATNPGLFDFLFKNHGQCMAFWRSGEDKFNPWLS